MSDSTGEKIIVTICAGTACYVMGASDILLLEDSMNEAYAGKVEVTGATCLGYCKDSKTGKAPYVLINGEVMQAATLPKVRARIEELLNAKH